VGGTGRYVPERVFASPFRVFFVGRIVLVINTPFPIHNLDTFQPTTALVVAW